MKPNWRKCGVVECFRDHACHNELSGRECLVTREDADRRRAMQEFAERISVRASYAELRVQRAFGEDWTDAYLASWRVMDEVYDLVFAAERPAVYLPCRTVSRANAGAPI